MAKAKINYKDIIDEISCEVEEGILTPNDSVQVLRDSKPVFESYCAILDWYYDAYTMEQELNTPIEEMYMPDEFSDAEWEQMKAEHAEMKAQYEADKPNLAEIKVKDVLTEMTQMQKLFK